MLGINHFEPLIRPIHLETVFVTLIRRYWAAVLILMMVAVHAAVIGYLRSRVAMVGEVATTSVELGSFRFQPVDQMSMVYQFDLHAVVDPSRRHQAEERLIADEDGNPRGIGADAATSRPTVAGGPHASTDPQSFDDGRPKALGRSVGAASADHELAGIASSIGWRVDASRPSCPAIVALADLGSFTPPFQANPACVEILCIGSYR